MIGAKRAGAKEREINPLFGASAEGQFCFELGFGYYDDSVIGKADTGFTLTKDEISKKCRASSSQSFERLNNVAQSNNTPLKRRSKGSPRWIYCCVRPGV
jgi:hypothetical protein